MLDHATLAPLLDHIVDNYAQMYGPDRADRVEAFRAGVQYKIGSKYAKIIVGGSAHSFVCLHDMGKFCKGDILMAASWNAPARNFARGNVCNKTFNAIRWSGC
jgi:hypothetical protein